MGRHSVKRTKSENLSPQQKMWARRTSLLVGPWVIVWCLYNLSLYANYMTNMVEQLSSSPTSAEASRDYSNVRRRNTEADFVVNDDDEDDVDDPLDSRNKDSSKTETTILRLSEVRMSRPTRQVMNQDEYRHVNSCPSTLPDEPQTTLVTQLDTERLWLANEICERWKEPIVMLVYFSEEHIYDDMVREGFFPDNLKAGCPQMDLILVVNDMVVNHENERDNLYPINLLRNLALEAARTSHVLLTDADFLPSQHLASDISSALQTRQAARQALEIDQSQRDALVVPAFEVEFKNDDVMQQAFLASPSQMSHMIPTDWDGLQTCMSNETCAVFHQKLCPQGHSSTRTDVWLKKDWYDDISSPNDTIISNIKRIPCMLSSSYEPYMVLPWCPSNAQDPPQRISPLYDERFVGYGKNKVQYIEHLRHFDYDFFVVPQGYLIHAPHAFSADRVAHDRNHDSVRSESVELWQTFQNEIHDKYGHQITFRKCTRDERIALAGEKNESLDNDFPDSKVSNEVRDYKLDEKTTGLSFFNTSALETNVFRLSQLRAARSTREVANQDEYIHMNSCPSNIPQDDLRTTLVTQLDAQRLWLATEICSRWTDPLVLLVYFANEEAFAEISATFQKGIATTCPHATSLFVVNDSFEPTLYPINLLRNLALEAAQTSHVLLTDADFLPSEDLSVEINDALRVRKTARKQLNTPAGSLDALVVPAFQFEFREKDKHEMFLKNPPNLAHLIPRQFDNLRDCVNSTTCMVFHEKHYPQGHSSTRTHLWLQKEWYQTFQAGDNKVKDISSVPCMDNQHYEPYLVLPWCSVGSDRPTRIAPLYDERFVGYGMNKNQYIEHIRHFSYDFWVVPKGFLIHAPHAFSVERVAWDADSDSLRSENKALWRQFKDEIHERYGHDIRFRRCSSLEKTEQFSILDQFKMPELGSKPIKIKAFPSSSLKSTFTMTHLQKTRVPRTFWNQDDFRNHTSCTSNIQKVETTLVTQLSAQRLWLANEICSRWNAPIVVLVYFPDIGSYESIAKSFLEEMETQCQQAQIIFVVNDSYEETLYPINLLRNLAIEAVQTSHLLLHDADFLPSDDLATQIGKALNIREKARHQMGIQSHEYDALVVPAFQLEFKQKAKEESFLKDPFEMRNLIPRGFDELNECLNSTTCTIFHEKHYPQGHSSTRTHVWLQKEWYKEVETAEGSTIRDLSHVRCLDSDFYEPYLVLPWCGMGLEAPQRLSPLYDERFVGYGMNKNQYFEHIRHLSYDFLIVPKGYLIHTPHVLSAERIAWDRNTDLLRRGNKQLFMNFTNDIHKHYGHNVKLKKCEWLEKDNGIKGKGSGEQTAGDYLQGVKEK